MTFLPRSSRLQLSCYKNHSSVVSPSFIMLPLYISSSRPGCCPPGPLVAAALYNLIIAPQYLPARDLSDPDVPEPLVLDNQLVGHLGAGNRLPEALTRPLVFVSVELIEIK